MASAHDRRALPPQPFWPAISILTVLAWSALLLWDVSPYGRYLDHGDWTRLGYAGAICALLPKGEILLPALLYTLGWLTMTAAMMLPTTAPLVALFRRMIRRRGDRRVLLALLLVGYAGVWTAFGLIAHLFGAVLVSLVRQSVWLTFNGWAIGAATLGLAGLFQFSKLKHRCLEQCRTPLAFIAARWQGSSARLEALRLGIAHGAYCLGCCWALMLIMFAIGAGSIGWMLALGVVMAIEKTHPAGRRLSHPLGLGLLAGAVLISLINLQA